MGAKAREATADARETTLDEWERRLAARADELRMPGWPVAAQLADARAARDRARRDRDEASRERDTAEADRDEATNRRHADHPAVRLAAVFAAIAEHLYASDSDEQVLQRIAETAVSTVTGCDMAPASRFRATAGTGRSAPPIPPRCRSTRRSTKRTRARAWTR